MRMSKFDPHFLESDNVWSEIMYKIVYVMCKLSNVAVNVQITDILAN